MLKPLSSKTWAAKYFPVLKIAGDPLLKAPVALNKAVCVVGRRLGVHLPLNSTKVSKVHALIVRQRDGVYIRDLASRNHVYVNGLAVRETDLDTGDSVRVGPYTLHCESGFGAAPAVTDDPQPLPAKQTPDAALQIVGEATLRPLEGRALLIGQRDDCDLTLDDQRVSPVHAVIFELDGKHVLRDLNSSAGAFVNNESVHQHELEPGDEIRIGRARMRYELLGTQSSPSDAIESATEDSDEDAALELITDEVPVVESAPAAPVEDAAWHDDDAAEHAASMGVMDAAVRHVHPDHDLISLNDEAEVGTAPASNEDQPIPVARQTLDDSRAPEQIDAQPPGGEEERAWPKEEPVESPPPAGSDLATQKLDQIVAELSEKVAALETTWKEVKDDVRQVRRDDPELAP